MASTSEAAGGFQPLPPPQPSLLPNYPELIMGAIEALNEPKGSNKTSISKHIESTLQTVPASHSTLLSHHLNSMRASGQLLLLNNNYLKPDPHAPPRRGRGRPPKPKDPLAASASASPSSPKPRGRPPKPKDPLAPPPAPRQPSSASGSKRKRGRPPKKLEAAAATAAGVSGGVKRGRGRPPKAKPSVDAVGS